MLNYQTLLSITEEFYAKAKIDILIGYHFRIIEDFETHIPKIADFWNLQLNGSLENRAHLPFHLFQTHKPLMLKQGEIDRWVKLFSDTLNENINKKTITNEQRDLWLTKIKFFKSKIESFI